MDEGGPLAERGAKASGVVLALEDGGADGGVDERGDVGGHLALEGGHGLHELEAPGAAGGGVADAPAGHGVGLGKAVDGDGPLGDLRDGADGEVGNASVGDL